MMTLIFGVFTFCYTTRTLYDWIIPPNRYFANIFSGICLPILWDFLPIFLMFLYHFKNKAETAESNSLLKSSQDT